MEKVITAPLAIIKVNGIAIGRMRGITVSENIQRGEVQGLGELTQSELPALKWTGSLQCDFYNIDFSKSQIPGAITRKVNTTKEFTDSVLLQQEGVTVELFKIVAAPNAPLSGNIPSTLQPYVSVKGLFLESESFNIAEGQVSGRNQSFRYLFPIIFPF